MRDLHYAYPSLGKGADPAWVLQGVDFQVARGEFVALLGRVGAGKSTLCMAMNGLVPHATGGVFRGDVSILGLNTKQHPVADLASRVGLVFQDPDSQLVHMRVEDEVAFGPENLGVPPAEIAERVDWALGVVGLHGIQNRSPLLLSGGEKQRVAIASMLAMRPQVLVLDEPTASLDPAGKAALLETLARLTGERRVTILMATQELDWVVRYADRALVLHGGRIALEGSPSEVFGNAPRLLEWGIGLPQAAELAHLLSQRTGRRYTFVTVEEGCEQLREQIVSVRSQRAERVQRVPVPPASPPLPSDRVEAPKVEISVEKVSYAYGDGTVALRDVSLNVSSGEFVALLGPNGSGKTTLAKHLNGLLRPVGGRVLVEGRDTRSARVADLARSVGYVFQNPDHQIFAPTVHSEVAFGLRIQGLPPPEVARRVAEAMDRFRLTAYADQPPASLGYGQRRQVALAAVIAVHPRVLILDEPTNGLDQRSRQELMEVVVHFHSLGHTIILITHDMSLVAEYATRALVLLGGRVLYDGAPSSLFSRPDLLAQAELAVPPVRRLADALGPGLFPAEVLTPAQFVLAWPRGGSGPAAHKSPGNGAEPGKAGRQASGDAN